MCGHPKSVFIVVLQAFSHLPWSFAAERELFV